MAQPYVGEIKMFAGNFAPEGWSFCQGQVIAISENDTLFALIGTTYGGDGQSTFALPDLRSRVPIHQGQGPGLSNYTLAQSGGAESVTLTVNQVPAHTHAMRASIGLANTTNPANAIIGASTAVTAFFGDPPTQNMNTAAISSVGGSVPHNNIQPYLAFNFIISMFGVFPQQS